MSLQTHFLKFNIFERMAGGSNVFEKYTSSDFLSILLRSIGVSVKVLALLDVRTSFQ